MIDFCLYDSESMIDTLIEKFEEGSEDEYGKREILTSGDERVILLNCMNYLGEVLMNTINQQANNNLVLYCDEPTLIYKGIERNVYRLPAKEAETSLRFYASNLARDAVRVPKGAMVTADGKVFFKTTNEITIQPGESGDVDAVSEEKTSAANGYTAGSINIMANTIPYIEKVENLTASSGGDDEESLESFRKRVLFAPLAYNTGGTEASYTQKTKEVSARIADVAILHDDDNIKVYILCQDGALPDDDLLELVKEYLSREDIKGTTDKIETYAAEQVVYSVDMTYKISKSDQARANEIKRDVEEAVHNYINEAGREMGHAINPEMIKKSAYIAGASSVDVTEPSFREISESQVAICESINITYGGVV